MNVLREKFSEHHALQCGFCTPGMLMTARDIITRLPNSDEERIRLELSGNLCRCTGYVGIVEAIQSALATVKASGQVQPSTHRPIGPAGSHPPATPKDFSQSPRPVEVVPAAQSAAAPAANFDPVDWTSVQRNALEPPQSFPLPFPPPQLCRFFPP